MDDVRAVMDAVGSKRAVLVGFSEGGCMSVLFAATYPERVSHLVLIGCFSRSADRFSDEAWKVRLDQIIKNWGSGELIKTIAPERGGQTRRGRAISRSSSGWRAVPARCGRFCSSTARSTSPRSCRRYRCRPWCCTARPISRCRSNSAASSPQQIPGVKYIEYPAGDHAFWTGDTETDARRHRGVRHRPSRSRRGRTGARAGDRAVHRHRRLHPQRGGDGRPALAPAARRSRSARASRWSASIAAIW